jgi:hypothetical protein
MTMLDMKLKNIAITTRHLPQSKKLCRNKPQRLKKPIHQPKAAQLEKKIVMSMKRITNFEKYCSKID